MEMRLLAVTSKDPRLLQFFQTATKKDDFFKFIASSRLNKSISDITEEERNRTKRIAYACVYGVGAKALAKDLEVSEDEAAKYQQNFFYKFPKIKEFRETTIATARRQGYITTISKRRRLLPEINSQDFAMKGYAERQAVNSLIQGTAADLMKTAMLNIHHTLKEVRRIFFLTELTENRNICVNNAA